MKWTLIAGMAAVITLAAVGQVHRYDPLTRNCELLKANPATPESGEAIRLAINRVIPQVLDVQQNGERLVIVTVAVDASGAPQCIAATEVSPLTHAGIEAVKGWKFDPYIVKDHAVPFVTRLTFHFTHLKVWVE